MELKGSAKYEGDIFKVKAMGCAFDTDDEKIKCKVKPVDEEKPYLTFKVNMDEWEKVAFA